MGTVWMAQQSEPVKRVVALKLIKAGMDSKQIIARFEAERQALALMDHPNIARVLDAGTSAAGSPYFVMDLVKGMLITNYCDEHHLTPRQRLELFIPICQQSQSFRVGFSFSPLVTRLNEGRIASGPQRAPKKVRVASSSLVPCFVGNYQRPIQGTSIFFWWQRSTVA